MDHNHTSHHSATGLSIGHGDGRRCSSPKRGDKLRAWLVVKLS